MNSHAADAQYVMGVNLETGKDGKRDLIAAAGWYTNQRCKGHAGAQMALARMYELGLE